MNTVKIALNGKTYQAEEKEPVLKVARREDVDIPALCYHEGLDSYGACRLCLVEVTGGGRPGMTTSCTLAATEGLEVQTDSSEIAKIRKGLLELYLAQAPDADYIKELAAQYGIKKSRFARSREPGAPVQKCVLCGLCVRICNEAIGASVISFISRGPETEVNSPYLEPSPKCIGCTACADVCPTDVIQITDKDGIRMVETWSDTQVAMKKCSMCGAYCAPEPLMDTVYRGVPDLDEEVRELCIKCRRRLKIRKFSQMTK